MIKDRKRAENEPSIDDPVVSEAPAEEIKEIKKVEKPAVVKKSVDVDAFIVRKLKVINELPDGAKKRNAAERVLKNKEV